MCEHKNFAANVDVNRIVHYEKENIISFAAELKIKCSDCGLPFEFRGFESGFSFHKPMINVNCQELRLPIIPSSDPVDQINAMLSQ
jgi:hypothetical protein